MTANPAERRVFEDNLTSADDQIIRWGMSIDARDQTILVGSPRKDVPPVLDAGMGFAFRPGETVRNYSPKPVENGILGYRARAVDLIGDATPDIAFMSLPVGTYVWDGAHADGDPVFFARPPAASSHWCSGAVAAQVVPGGKQELVLGSPRWSPAGKPKSWQSGRLLIMQGDGKSNAPAFEDVPVSPGYPRPFSFRAVTSKRLPYMDWMTMVVSDMHLRSRQGAEAKFKEQYPDRPVLVQINAEGLGLWGTWICLPPQRLEDIGLLQPAAMQVLTELSERAYPMLDFPGHWTYEAGADTTTTIPAGAETATIGVEDIAPFMPSSHSHSTNRLKQDSFNKDIVICPRGDDGQLDWLRAEFASIESLDTEGSVNHGAALDDRGRPVLRTCGRYLYGGKCKPDCPAGLSTGLESVSASSRIGQLHAVPPERHVPLST